jgi:hypothetical protein
MWTVVVVSLGHTAYYGRKLRRAIRAHSAELPSVYTNRVLADWCRNTNLTVIAVTGTEFTMSLADLANSEHPYRSWNVPVSAAVWSEKDPGPQTLEQARVR